MTFPVKSTLIWLFLIAIMPLAANAQTESDTSAQKSMNALGMDTYSISLNVADISASVAFYEKLGFAPVKGMGGIEQKWVIMSNGTSKIGLFQGLFPTNTITFNPTDGRTVYKTVTESGIEPVFQTGMDKASGPCTFSVLDPDGNPILIDQH